MAQAAAGPASVRQETSEIEDAAPTGVAQCRHRLAHCDPPDVTGDEHVDEIDLDVGAGDQDTTIRLACCETYSRVSTCTTFLINRYDAEVLVLLVVVRKSVLSLLELPRRLNRSVDPILQLLMAGEMAKPTNSFFRGFAAREHHFEASAFVLTSTQTTKHKTPTLLERSALTTTKATLHWRETNLCFVCKKLRFLLLEASSRHAVEICAIFATIRRCTMGLHYPRKLRETAVSVSQAH